MSVDSHGGAMQGTGSTPGPRSDRPLIAPTANTAQSSMVVSASFLLSSVFGALLAVLLALIVGESPETDAFLAAYSVYLIFALFGSNLRVALVPLLGAADEERTFRHAAAERIGRLLAATALLTAGLTLASPVLGPLLVPGASDDAKDAAALSLAILGLASFAQIWAATFASVLNAARRFTASAAIYVASSASTVGIAAALMAFMGVTGAALGVLGGALVLAVGHVAYTRRFDFTVLPAFDAIRRPDTWALMARLLAGSAIPFVVQVSVAIALAAVSDQVGAVTAYTYAYSLMLLLSAVTSAAIGLVTMPALVSALAQRGPVAAEEYFLSVSPIAVFLYLPLAAAFAVFGRAPLDLVLEGALSQRSIELLWDVARVFLLMGVAWAILAPLTTVALSLRMHSRLAVLAAALIPAQAIAVAIASPSGPRAVAIAHAAVGVALVLAVAVMVFGRKAGRAGLRAVARSLPAGGLALVFPALGLLGLSSGAATSIAAVAVGLAAYVGLGVVLWPAVGGAVVRAVRR
ncbi:MAG: lipid II flippase MurJ [Solirubrobacteraceae bacterium]